MDYYRLLFKKYWKPMIAAAVTGTVAGSGYSALIIALIHRQLRQDAAPEPYLPLAFGLFIVAYYILQIIMPFLIWGLVGLVVWQIYLAHRRGR